MSAPGGLWAAHFGFTRTPFFEVGAGREVVRTVRPRRGGGPHPILHRRVRPRGDHRRGRAWLTLHLPLVDLSHSVQLGRVLLCMQGHWHLQVELVVSLGFDLDRVRREVDPLVVELRDGLLMDHTVTR